MTGADPDVDGGEREESGSSDSRGHGQLWFGPTKANTYPVWFVCVDVTVTGTEGL